MNLTESEICDFYPCSWMVTLTLHSQMIDGLEKALAGSAEFFTKHVDGDAEGDNVHLLTPADTLHADVGTYPNKAQPRRINRGMLQGGLVPCHGITCHVLGTF